MRFRSGLLAIICVVLLSTTSQASEPMGWLNDARDTVSRYLFSGTSTYAAIEPNGRRKSVSSQIQSEDKVLNANRRRLLAANAFDLHRNCGILAWAIRQHLNYVALFDFYASSPDRGFNDDLQALIARDSKKEVFDIGGRHSLSRFRRLMETQKTLSGDVLPVKLRSGHLQGIESHQIVDPAKKYPNSKWKQGCLLGTGNRAIAYNVRDAEKRDQMVSAENGFLFGAFEGRFDQVRGISSLPGEMNAFRDLGESFDYARAKLKVEQLFALAIERDAESVENTSTLGRRVDGADDSESDEDEVDETQTPQVDFGNGPVQLNLDPGEKAKFLTGTNPSNESQAFLRLSIHMAILALDLPMNFWDPQYVNMSGGRTSWNQYERSCVQKREDQLEFHEWWSRWRVARYMLPRSVGGTGELILPRSMSMNQVLWEWVPRGVPWWKPAEELEAELRACGAGLDTPQKICRRHGNGDFYRNLEELKLAREAAARLGLTLEFGNPSQPFTIVTKPAEA